MVNKTYWYHQISQAHTRTALVWRFKATISWKQKMEGFTKVVVRTTPSLLRASGLWGTLYWWTNQSWVHVLWGQQEDSWQQQSEWHYQSVIKWKRVIQWYTPTNFISYGREVRSYSKWPKLQWCHFGVRISDLIFLHFRYWFEWFCLRRSVNISTCHSLGAHAWEFKVI